MREHSRPGEEPQLAKMAVTLLFDTLPLHYLQHFLSKFGTANVLVALFTTALLGVLADWGYMLYLRSKMVRLPFPPIYCSSHFIEKKERERVGEAKIKGGE